MILSISKLNKTYGSNHALKDFTFNFTPGVYGLLGPNGAGKSTLMNLVTDTIAADSGEIYFDGENIWRLGKEFRKVLGYMPQQQGLYQNFTLVRFLYYMAALKGVPKSQAKEQIPRLIQRLNLVDHQWKRLGSFSGGMKQRALIAQAMLGNPKVLIFDEPTAGLDPKERIRIRNLIAEIAMDKIVIIATHVVSDIQFIAKEILMLKKGIILASGPAHVLCKQLENKVFEIQTSKEHLETISSQFKVGNISKDDRNLYVRILSEDPPSNYEYTVASSNLEDLYLYMFDDESKE